MNPIELKTYFRTGKTITEFCRKHDLDEDSECIEILMEKPFLPKGDLYFFEIERTNGEGIFKFGNKKLSIFSNLYLLEEFLEWHRNGDTSLEIAKRWISYVVNDA